MGIVSDWDYARPDEIEPIASRLRAYIDEARRLTSDIDGALNLVESRTRDVADWRLMQDEMGRFERYVNDLGNAVANLSKTGLDIREASTDLAYMV